MDVVNIFGLLAVVVANIAAVSISFIRNKNVNARNIVISNGRGTLIVQIARMQDDILEIREDVAELKGTVSSVVRRTDG
jgi:hypothetical protein